MNATEYTREIMERQRTMARVQQASRFTIKLAGGESIPDYSKGTGSNLYGPCSIETTVWADGGISQLILKEGK